MAAPFAARSTQTVERMARERAQASFPVREMTYYLDGGKAMTDIKVRMCVRFGRVLGGWGLVRCFLGGGWGGAGGHESTPLHA